MPEPPARQPTGTITVLSFSTADDDHVVLGRALRESSLTLYPNCRMRLEPCNTLSCALAALRHRRIPIVICDGDAHPAVWRQIVEESRNWPAPPCVIVTSREADDAAWAETLGAGAFDVLPKPFDRAGVMRILQSAWNRWRNRYGLGEDLREPATGT